MPTLPPQVSMPASPAPVNVAYARCPWPGTIMEVKTPTPLKPHATSHSVFQEPKTLPEYKHFEPSHPFEPFTGRNQMYSFEAPPS
jgi:hypothetical protein